MIQLNICRLETHWK